VVVPVRERRRKLRRALDAILAQRGAGEDIKSNVQILLNTQTRAGAHKQHAYAGGLLSELNARAHL
jgi:hypothetical protein